MNAGDSGIAGESGDRHDFRNVKCVCMYFQERRKLDWIGKAKATPM